MTGEELLKQLKKFDQDLLEKEIYVNFSYKGNCAYLKEILSIDVECTGLNMFINIGKIDKDIIR